MPFLMPKYKSPNFKAPMFENAPDANIAAVVKNGVAPENYHATSIYPEYFKVNGKWVLATETRMDSVAVLRENGHIDVVEFRNLRVGDQVFLGRTERCEEGIYLHLDGFTSEDKTQDVFAFRTGRSRETAFSRDYDFIYQLLEYERDHGKIVWVLGPACAFDADARSAMVKLVENGYVHALLAGNALATHDLEGALLHTALGQDIYTQRSQPNGHYNHLDVLNKVRKCGSISDFIEKYGIQDGIIHACEKTETPYVLAGSIRDDGPLPEIYGNVYEAANEMREHIRGATMVICLATMLHTIATGNMTPTFRVIDGEIRPVYFYVVDMSEFVANKLTDRGSLSSISVVTNVQDFLVNLSRNVKMFTLDVNAKKRMNTK